MNLNANSNTNAMQLHAKANANVAKRKISTFIPEIYLKLIASITFLVIGSRLIYDSINKKN